MPASTTTGFLRLVPVLSGLDDELLSRLASEVTEREIRAGEWLMRRGDEGDSLYLVRSGQLEVVDEGPPEAVIRVLRRGGVLGELALLTRQVRSASVRARRDCWLLELERDRFEHLITESPDFAVGLTRAMGAQLAATRALAGSAGPPRTIAGLALDDGAPIDEAASMLIDFLARYGSVVQLDKRSRQRGRAARGARARGAGQRPGGSSGRRHRPRRGVDGLLPPRGRHYLRPHSGQSERALDGAFRRSAGVRAGRARAFGAA